MRAALTLSLAIDGSAPIHAFLPDVIPRAREPEIAPVLEKTGGTIGSMAEGAALTYADLEAFPDDGLRRELLDGELIVSPSPQTRHQRLSMRLSNAFFNFIRENGGGEIFHAPFDVILSDINVVEPDLLFIDGSQMDILTKKNVVGVPALVIEIVSDARIDRVRKRDIYARFGVPEYWIVDPDADRIEVHTLADDGYGKPAIFEPGEHLTYGRLPGFRLDLTELFAR